jgi:C-terminal processing protease CtpA/Prc
MLPQSKPNLSRLSSLLASISLLFAAPMVLPGCKPVPGRVLSVEEKTADLYWIFSRFNENYAPLEMKQQLHGIQYQELKQQALRDAAATTNNEEFYRVMLRFVSSFRDAHTSATLNPAQLPGRSRVAYLGFSGKRKGDTLVVTELLPTIQAGSAFPIRVGDIITHLNGTALPQVVENELVPFKDLGQREANLTLHMSKIFNRISLNVAMPTEADARLTLKRGSETQDITLPWIIKDLVAFQQEQNPGASRSTNATASGANLTTFLTLTDPASTSGVTGNSASPLQLALQWLDFNGIPTSLTAHWAQITSGHAEFNPWDSFIFLDQAQFWSNAPVATASPSTPQTPLERLQAIRSVPSRAIPISSAVTYPAYVSRETLTRNGTTQTKLVGTILVDTFSPSRSSTAVLEEFKETLRAMKELGVQDLVIDMINNGGGSLGLGLQMAQALSPQAIELPRIQLRLSDSWIDDFNKESRTGDSDAERELARRVTEQLEAARRTGSRLSSAMNIDALMPYSFSPNRDLDQKFNVVLLVNEMCASMCDIFTAVLKDNQMATVVGAQTMGAGGNVVNYAEAPNSNLSLRQTESLILRKDGSYIENHGIMPDVAVAVNESVLEKYGSVRNKGVETLLSRTSP